MKPNQVWSVAELNRWIKHVLERDERLGDVWVRGEISNFTHHTSGHMYFTLKDRDSKIRVVMFASYNRFLKFMPKDGTKALVRGSISAFERDGTYQLYAREMQPDGLGSLYLAFEQLKAKLEAEGLFAPERKRPLPAFPKRVGVVTSPTGAAIRDICTTIKRRYPMAEIVIAPAIVQGTEAPASIVTALQIIHEAPDIDVLIVGRGGGSIEELWAFNDERVARAIAASRIPVISAVGHETDFTIADFVADLRAATPTAAAELAVPHYLEWLERVKQLDLRLHRALRGQVQQQRLKLERLQTAYALRQPRRRLEESQQRLDEWQIRMQHAVRQLLARQRDRHQQLVRVIRHYRPQEQLRARREQVNQWRGRLHERMVHRTKASRSEWGHLVAQLEALSPLKVMQRGFSLTYKDGKLIKSARAIEAGDKLMIRLSDGSVTARVEEIAREENQNGSQKSGNRNGNTI